MLRTFRRRQILALWLAAFAWAFPCAADIDTNITTQARLYAGSKNPQVGGVPDSSIHPVLNGLDLVRRRLRPPPQPSDFTSPAGPICNTKTLDVKLTEDNSFPLLSLIPLFPDIKRQGPRRDP